MKLVALVTLLTLAGHAAAAPAPFADVPGVQQRDVEAPNDALDAAERYLREALATLSGSDSDHEERSTLAQKRGKSISQDQLDRLAALATVEEYLRDALATIESRDATGQGQGREARGVSPRKTVQEMVEEIANIIKANKGNPWAGTGGTGASGGSGGSKGW
ncbi:uncharacterized protein LOC62_03G003592 [Vanrija pseudolonga]|uniref:Uncharacterized protein n=1 Tax=Vanrija pseudolonga TaxID=143232 RepID=A0AAF1BGQ4_9TREE|nr:hypothetical protein LOC62_03G003592 [Vanrija pseudolonga]